MQPAQPAILKQTSMLSGVAIPIDHGSAWISRAFPSTPQERYWIDAAAFHGTSLWARARVHVGESASWGAAASRGIRVAGEYDV